MSKRYIPLLSQATKKPRLDCPQTSRRKLSITATAPKEPPVENIDQFFDDEDDDDLLFATQKIELDFSTITFSGFQHGVSASTQRSNEDEDEKKEEEVIKQDLESFFLDDDDDWNNIEASIQLMPPPAAPPPSVQAAKQKESNNRIQYLQDRVQEFTSQNTQLQVNADEYKEKLQTKEGEVTNLREQLKQLKKQMDTLRLEKVQECDRVRQKYTQEVHDLRKKLEAEKTDTKFKEHEISRLKVKCLDESQRFNASIVEQKAILKVPKNIFKMSISFHPKTEEINIPLEIYEECNLRKTMYSTLVIREFEKLKNQIFNPTDSLILESFKTVLEAFPCHFSIVDKSSLEWTNFDGSGSIFCSKPIYINEKEMQLRRFLGLISIFCSKSSKLCEQVIVYKENMFLILKLVAESSESCAFLGVIEAFANLLIVLMKHCLTKATIVSETEDFIFDYLKRLVFCTPNERVLKYISKILCILSRTHGTQQQICSSLCQKTTLGIYIYDASSHTYKFREDTCVLQIYANFLETSFKDTLSRTDEVFGFLKEICWFHGNFLRNCIAKCIDSVGNAPHWILNRENSDLISSTISRQDSDITQASTSSVSLRSMNSFDSAGQDKAVCRCYLKAVRSFVVILYHFSMECSKRKKEISKSRNIFQKSVEILFYTLHVFQFDILNNYIKLQNTTRLRLITQFFENYKEQLNFNEMQEFALRNLLSSTVLRHNSQDEEDEDTNNKQNQINIDFENSRWRKSKDDCFF